MINTLRVIRCQLRTQQDGNSGHRWKQITARTHAGNAEEDKHGQDQDPEHLLAFTTLVPALVADPEQCDNRKCHQSRIDRIAQCERPDAVIPEEKLGQVADTLRLETAEVFADDKFAEHTIRVGIERNQTQNRERETSAMRTTLPRSLARKVLRL